MKMISLKWMIFVCLVIGAVNCDREPSPSNDNDFADFEDFDSDDFITVSDENTGSEQNIKEDDSPANADNVFQDDDEDEDNVDNEFDHFNDDEEFEGFNKETATAPVLDQTTGEPKLTVAKVPLHFG